MPTTVKIYGASDDLVEVEGKGIREEYDQYDRPGFLHFDDGTVVKVEYSPNGYEGKWKVEVVKLGHGTVASHVPAPNDDDDYSDTLTLTGNISGVKHRSNAEGTRSRDELIEALEDKDWRDMVTADLNKIADILKV